MARKNWGWVVVMIVRLLFAQAVYASALHWERAKLRSRQEAAPYVIRPPASGAGAQAAPNIASPPYVASPPAPYAAPNVANPPYVASPPASGAGAQPALNVANPPTVASPPYVARPPASGAGAQPAPYVASSPASGGGATLEAATPEKETTEEEPDEEDTEEEETEGEETDEEPTEEETTESFDFNQTLPDCKAQFYDKIEDKGKFWDETGAGEFADGYINHLETHTNWVQKLYMDLFPTTAVHTQSL